MTDLALGPESALNLTLMGSVGSFQVGTGRAEQQSLEVRYFMTHIGLNFGSSSNDQLLSALAPFREVFDFKSLEFDEIMQRDIDDARVSADLIPYLLDEKSRDIVKLFPPIVIVVLPTEENRNRPAPLYPKVEKMDLPAGPGRPNALRVLRSGPIGQEAFAFEQPIVNGSALQHDLTRMKLNVHRTRLVIVDGQHRAMALLALYRNLKDGWTDERAAPFKDYYAAWTPNYLSRFNLKEINLPVIICTVPNLCEGYTGTYSLKQAARSIFLTLNKNARKVSDSRNKLLDDNDLIALFMRRTMSEIKHADSRSSHAFRIWNVELDQVGDRMKLQNAVALTGVNHLYYIVEHLLLNDDDIAGVAPRSGKFYKRKDFRTYHVVDRLHGRDILGGDVADTITRDIFTNDAAEKLGQSYDAIFGNRIIQAMTTFGPFESHARAVLLVETALDRNQDRQLRPILFDGQGIGRVFDAHREKLKQLLDRNYFDTDVPTIEANLIQLNATAARISDILAKFRTDRANLYFGEILSRDKWSVRQSGTSDLDPRAIDWCNRLFGDVFTSVAFQAALICTFFDAVETVEREARSSQSSEQVPVDIDAAYVEYLAQLSTFFVPKTAASLKKLVRVMSNEVGEDADLWKLKPSNQTFRAVVFNAEMQPDQWPRYRYLLLELWKPTDATLTAFVQRERDHCRNQIFASLRESYRAAYCQEHRRDSDEISAEEHKEIFDKTFEAYAGLIKNLDAPSLNKNTMRDAGSQTSANAANQQQDET